MIYDEKIEVSPLGTVTIRRKMWTRHITIKINQEGEIITTIPAILPTSRAESFLRANSDKIIKKLAKLSTCNKATLPTDPIEIEKLRKQAKTQLTAELHQLATQHHLTVNKVTIKNNKTNWGSCSTKGNINLNIRLMLLPPHLRQYIMLHELAHLKHLNHSPEFHTYLNALCNGHEKALSQELRTWKIC